MFDRGRVRQRRWRAAITGCLAALLAAVACGGQQAGRPSGPHARPASPTASPHATGSLADWQKRGATEVPPASLQQITMGSTQVVNDTGGAVSEGDARSWAAAFLRSYGYLQWAVMRGQDQFLIRGGLSAAPLAIFRPNLNDILAARQVNGHIEYSPQVFRRLIVRHAPQSLQPVYASEQFVWTPFAIYLDAIGPAQTTLVDAGGSRGLQLSAREASDVVRSGPEASQPHPSGLTRRELDVVELVAEGLTSREIASRLYLSERTVENHIAHVLNKLGLQNRTQVAAWALSELSTHD